MEVAEAKENTSLSGSENLESSYSEVECKLNVFYVNKIEYFTLTNLF